MDLFTRRQIHCIWCVILELTVIPKSWFGVRSNFSKCPDKSHLKIVLIIVRWIAKERLKLDVDFFQHLQGK